MKRTIGALFAVSLSLGAWGCQAADCRDLKRDAEALRDDAQRCSAGDTCELADFYEIAGPNSCLAAFQCTQPVRSGVDLDELGRRAKAIADDYQQCDECAMAGCVDPNSLEPFCDEAKGRCEVRMK